MVQDEARRNFVKEVYVPYKVKTYTSRNFAEDEKPESLFYALIPAGVYSIVGEDAFIDIVNAGFSSTYDKDGNILSEEEPFLGLYVEHTNEQGIPHLEYEDPEVDGIFYQFVPISWDEFPHERFNLETINCMAPVVENTVQIVRVYLDDFIKDRCEGKSPLDLYKYVDSTFFYEFFTDVVKWARALSSAS